MSTPNEDARADLERAIRALTVDIEEGDRPNGPAEAAFEALVDAIQPHHWANGPLGRGYLGPADVEPRLRRANLAAAAYCKAMAEQLGALKRAAKAYFGVDFGAPDPAEEVVHASGFPGWGPPTLCGEPGKTPEVCGEVTCPKCNDILAGGGPALAARVAEVEAKYGKPTISDDFLVNEVTAANDGGDA